MRIFLLLIFQGATWGRDYAWWSNYDANSSFNQWAVMLEFLKTCTKQRTPREHKWTETQRALCKKTYFSFFKFRFCFYVQPNIVWNPLWMWSNTSFVIVPSVRLKFFLRLTKMKRKAIWLRVSNEQRTNSSIWTFSLNFCKLKKKKEQTIDWCQNWCKSQIHL